MTKVTCCSTVPCTLRVNCLEKRLENAVLETNVFLGVPFDHNSTLLGQIGEL